MLNPSQKIQRPHLSAILKEKELWILVLLGMLYFYRPLFLGETFFFRDLFMYFFPQKRLLMDFITTGELPLWDPYLHGGLPYLANIANTVLVPSNLLYFFLPFLKAFNVNIILHAILCPVFMYCFSRVIGLRPLASLIAAVVYGFCGYMLSLINLLAGFLAVPYLPLSFLFWHLYLLEGKRKWFIISVIVGVVRVFSGGAEINVISMLSLLGWTLFYPYRHRALYQKILLWSFLGIFIVGIASIQLFPAIEMLLQSSRGSGLDYAVFTQWSLYPSRLPELIVPRFFGNSDTLLPQIDYWGGGVMKEPGPYILSIYFGCIVVTLAIIGGIRKYEDRIIPFRVRCFLLSLGILSLLFSFGRFLPFFHFLYLHVPFITIFRFPIKFFIAGIFPLAILTGYTSEIHFATPLSGMYRNPHKMPPNHQMTLWTPSQKFLGVLWSISALLLIFTITYIVSNDMANRFEEIFFNQTGEVIHQGLSASFVHISGVWIGLTILYHYRRMKKTSWQQWILACFLIIDLCSAGTRVNPFAPSTFFTDSPDIVPVIHQEIGEGRLFRTKDDFSELTIQAPSREIMWLFRWSLEVLKDYVGALYRIPVIFHSDFDGLASTRIHKLYTLMDSLQWERRLPLLSAGGVTLILTSDNISIPGIQRLIQVPNRSNAPFYLYRNETAAARVEFMTNWKAVSSDEEALEVMLHPTYDPKKQVVLQQPHSSLFEPYVSTTSVADTNLQVAECAPVQIKKGRADTLSASFLLSNNCDGYLVFSEPFYPGWHASVNGKPTPILRANFAFSAVFLEAGEHEVERYYRSNAVLAGIVNSAIFCLGLGLMVYTRKGDRKYYA